VKAVSISVSDFNCDLRVDVHGAKVPAKRSFREDAWTGEMLKKARESQKRKPGCRLENQRGPGFARD
jgi:hypothetical protein